MASDNGFIITKDIYKRGNGRWAKISRGHDKIGERLTSYGIQTIWKAKYCVAFGIEGEMKARDVRSYGKKCNALAFAEMYIEDGYIVD